MSAVAGVYLLTAPNGRCYVGQSWNIKKRWDGYAKDGARNQPRLRNSLAKYGFASFTRQVLVTAANQEQLDTLEIFWIGVFDAAGREGLNCRSGGAGGGCHSEESKNKMRAALKGREVSANCRAVVKALFTGVPKTPEHRAKIAESHKGIRPTEETKQKISAAHKGKECPPAIAERLRTFWVGRTHSAETIEKMRASAKARLGKE